MDKNRIEAFSDGVIAILITIMVLEMKAPHEPTWDALKSIFPIFLSYILSFVYLGIYWNNHHHLFKAAKEVDGRVLWANLLLLFFLSLIPFMSAWMGENHFAQVPVMLYGIDLLLAAVSYWVLVRTLIHHHGKNSLLAQAIGDDFKGNISVGLYLLAIVLSFLHPFWACALYAAVAIIWIVPDKRIERVFMKM